MHVVRDVGDVHAEPVVAVRQPLDGDGVVEVARVLAVDRHRRDRLRKSVRPRMSRSLTAVPEPTRLLDGLSVRVGMLNLRMMISVSTPGSLIGPSTSTTRSHRTAARRRPARDLDDDHLAALGST